MATRPLALDKIQEARRLRAQGMTISAIAKAMRLSTGVISKYCKASTPLPEQRNSEPEGPGFSEREDGSAICTTTSAKPIKTLEDAVKVAGVDLTVWYVEKWECAQWTTTLNIKAAGESSAEMIQQYRVKLFLKRIIPRAIRDAIDLVFERMKKHAPKYPALSTKKSRGNCLAVFGLFDSHFGKLAWMPETGNDYDLHIAENLFRHAVEDLLNEAQHRPIGRVLLPLGNDFFHIDNRRNTTFQGTPQDVDSRYPKIFSAGKLAVVWAIELLAGLAPVDVIWVPGNHDPTISYHLVETIASWFRHVKHIQVDVGPCPRKYFSWGCNLLGFTHGHVIKPEALPSLMATEKPVEWGASTCREWLLGHQHRSRNWTTKPVDTHQGTTIRVLRALTGDDAWHHENGFVGASQAAEVYFYDKELGYVGHGVAPGRM